MKSVYRLLASAGVAAILSGMYCAPAWAGDEKTIPATGCEVLSGTGTAVRDANGRIFNTSLLGEITVICPLVRDNVIAAPLRVTAFVIDNSSTLVGPDNISCRIRSMSPNGASATLGPSVSTTGTNSAGTQLLLTPVLEFDRGAYAVHCTIPRRGTADPSSGIASITIDEPL